MLLLYLSDPVDPLALPIITVLRVSELLNCVRGRGVLATFTLGAPLRRALGIM
jgi:hypothetical protein